MNTLYCALSISEFNRISSCQNARDMWHVLAVTDKNINQVKEFKIDMLVHQYELFKMFPNESITSRFTIMTTITNSLDALGMTYTNADIVRKFLGPCQSLRKQRWWQSEKLKISPNFHYKSSSVH